MHPPGQSSAIRRDIVIELLVAIGVLLVWIIGLGLLAHWKPAPWTGQSTDLWPFYVRAEWRADWRRALMPLGAFLLAWPILRSWTRRLDFDPVALLAGMVFAAFAFHLACGITRNGVFSGFLFTFSRTNEYWSDVPFVNSRFLSQFPDVGPLSQHGETHPPGIILLLALVKWIGFAGTMEAEAVCSTFAALTAFPLYGAARRLAGEDVARLTVALFLYACSVSAFAVLAMDCFVMFLAASAMYGLAVALDGKWWGGALWGLAFAAATFCHYLAFALGVTYGFVIWSRRTTLDRKHLIALAIGPLAFLLFYADLILGYRYRPIHVLKFQMAKFNTTVDVQRDRLHFAIGSPIAFVGALGLPLMGLVGRSLGGAIWRTVRRTESRYAPLILGASLPWIAAVAAGKPRGEVEHVFLMFVPAVVLGASAAAHHWYQRSPRWVSDFAVPLMVAQSIIVELSLNTFW